MSQTIEVEPAAASLAASRGWTIEYARGIVTQVLASSPEAPVAAPLPVAAAPVQGQFCICDGPIHRYDPSWCRPPRFVNSDGRPI